MRQAFLCIGTLTDVLPFFPEDDRVPGTDVQHMSVDRLGIDEARTLRRESSLRPFNRSYRTFVIAFTSATGEAQNALLKTLEEPAEGTQLYVVVPREDVLLATVRSRLVLLDGAAVDTLVPREAATFLARTPAERLADIAEKIKEKDFAWMESVLTGLEIHAHTERNHELMREVLFVREYFAAPGSSKKMLLEQLSLSI
ncbi:hypothetical protein GW943_00750 [Candidatus Parcubacteria bacterium]|uniref:DNA polymerase III subunit delta n=1 Tax=Candidatus Kaiserbacteria bacterium CG10_big_fil_rev_8_21_14_0_10_47_16 TaxID=1974608 RepID=A0A2H0UD84_9BACT|nr:hypothetical protein [Candidatus Parcubacteria bacterium]PIR84369.1 MAG: hypothetical protein COU16_02135 [Candidatus Kaiserbacteria bacterium CG10_big_fil_rev_8_21_14_0_10_47_16]